MSEVARPNPASAALSTRSSSPVAAAASSGASRATSLRCVACGALTALAPVAACPQCLGPLAVEYDLRSVEIGPPGTGLPGFAALLPPVADPARAYALESTPLRPAPQLAAELGLAELWLKDDTVLPTGSFKDRAATVAVALAHAWGFPAVGCASTGNLAAATARAAARAGLPSVVFVPRGLPDAKLAPARRFGARVVEVDGSYDAANRIAFLAGERVRLGVVNVHLRPFYTEGSKTLWHESIATLAGAPPDHVVVPLGSGALLAATHRGIEESRRLGALGPDRSVPRLIGTQPEGCSPIVDAFERGDDAIRPVEHPHTIAESLAIGDPASGPEALRAIRTTGGVADRPSAAEVRRGIRDLASLEGIWVEPAGGTVVATLRRLRESGHLGPRERVLAFLTGAGWKAPDGTAEVADGAEPLRIDPRRPDLEPLVAWVGSSRSGAAPW